MTDAYGKVLISRSKDRLRTTAVIDALFENFFEMHGDRRFGDDRAVICGIAFFNKQPVTVIAIDKGGTVAEKVSRNFGSPHPEGYRKAIRAMLLAEKFNRPIICLVDTAGAYCGIGAEERGQANAIAESITTMLSLKTPVITILTGEGGSGGALALSSGDRVFMLENSVFSVISPEGCASILWKDAKKAAEAANNLKLTAQDLYGFGICDGIISEDGDVFNNIRAEVESALNALLALTKDELMLKRYKKHREAGTKYV